MNGGGLLPPFFFLLTIFIESDIFELQEMNTNEIVFCVMYRG